MLRRSAEVAHGVRFVVVAGKKKSAVRAYGHMMVDGERMVFVPRYDESWGLTEVAKELDLYIDNLRFRRKNLKYISVDVNNMPNNPAEINLLWKLMVIGNAEHITMCSVDFTLQHAAALLGYFTEYDPLEAASKALWSLHKRRRLEIVGESVEGDGYICLPLVFRGVEDAPILSRPNWGPLP